MHWHIKFLARKLDTNNYRDLSPKEIDALINLSMWDFIEIFYSGNNFKQYKLGFEVTQQRIDMLSNLVIPKCIEPELIDEECGRYEVKLDNLDPAYMHLVRAYIKTPCCGLINIKPKQHDDLNKVLTSKFQKPSKKWKRAISYMQSSSDDATNSSIIIETGNEFTIEEVCIDYIKCPQRVYFGNYDLKEGKNKYVGYNTVPYITEGTSYQKGDPPVDPCISKKYYPLLVRMVVQEIHRILEDTTAFQLFRDKINTLA